jgi:hypothetical protein
VPPFLRFKKNGEEGEEKNYTLQRNSGQEVGGGPTAILQSGPNGSVSDQPTGSPQNNMRKSKLEAEQLSGYID